MLKIGAMTPDFTLMETGGGRVSLATTVARGPVVLFFVKLNCSATDLAAPFVEHIWDAYGEHESAEGTRLSVIGVVQENLDGAERFKSQHGIRFPLLVDGGLAVSRACEIDCTPTLVLLRGVEKLRADAGGASDAAPFRIVDVVEGWSKQGIQALVEDIAARIGALPVDLLENSDSVPESRPG